MKLLPLLLFLLACLVGLQPDASARAAEIEVILSDEPIAVGESTELFIELRGARISGEITFPDLPEGLRLEQPAELQRLQTARQRIYFLVGTEPGEWLPGRVVVPTDVGTRQIEPPPLRVREEPRGAAAALGTSNGHLAIAADLEHVYPGQQGLAEATLYLPVDTRIQAALSPLTLDRDNLVARPSVQFEPAGQRRLEGTWYNTWTFPVRFTALEGNHARLGPARVELQVIQTRFSGPEWAPRAEYEEQRLELSSGVLDFEIRDLPAGAPATFRGAVGHYQLRFEEMSPSVPRHGEPIYLEFTAVGEGDLALLPAPVPVDDTNWTVESLTANSDTHADKLPGDTPERRFTLLLRPRTGHQPTRLPDFELSFYNPVSGRYEASRTESPALPPGSRFNLPAAPAAGGPVVVDETGSSAEVEEDIVVAPLPLEPGAPLPWRRSTNWIDYGGVGLLTLVLLGGLGWRLAHDETRLRRRRLLRPMREARTLREANEALRCFARDADLPQPAPAAIRELRSALENECYRDGNVPDCPLDAPRRREILRTLHPWLPGRRRRRALARHSPLLLALLLLAPSLPGPVEAGELEADPGWQAFVVGDADQAYDHWIEFGRRQGFSANLCTHLGNAAYRMERLPQAVLWYRRALLLEPGHELARHNLELAEASFGTPMESGSPFDDPGLAAALRGPLWVLTRANYWLAAALCLVPLAFRLRRARLWWVAGSLTLGFALAGLAIEHLWRAAGEPEEHLVLLEPAALLSAPVRSSTNLDQMEAGISCRVLAERGSWNYVEIGRDRELPVRGWLPPGSGQALWPPQP